MYFWVHQEVLLLLSTATTEWMLIKLLHCSAVNYGKLTASIISIKISSVIYLVEESQGKYRLKHFMSLGAWSQCKRNWAYLWITYQNQNKGSRGCRINWLAGGENLWEEKKNRMAWKISGWQKIRSTFDSFLLHWSSILTSLMQLINKKLGGKWTAKRTERTRKTLFKESQRKTGKRRIGWSKREEMGFNFAGPAILIAVQIGLGPNL